MVSAPSSMLMSTSFSSSQELRSHADLPIGLAKLNMRPRGAAAKPPKAGTPNRETRHRTAGSRRDEAKERVGCSLAIALGADGCGSRFSCRLQGSNHGTP
jgi:hypothetical protein